MNNWKVIKMNCYHCGKPCKHCSNSRLVEACEELNEQYHDASKLAGKYADVLSRLTLYTSETFVTQRTRMYAKKEERKTIANQRWIAPLVEMIKFQITIQEFQEEMSKEQCEYRDLSAGLLPEDFYGY